MVRFLNQDLIEYDMDEEYERFSYLLDLYKDRDITVALSGGRDSACMVKCFYNTEDIILI